MPRVIKPASGVFRPRWNIQPTARTSASATGTQRKFHRHVNFPTEYVLAAGQWLKPAMQFIRPSIFRDTIPRFMNNEREREKNRMHAVYGDVFNKLNTWFGSALGLNKHTLVSLARYQSLIFDKRAAWNIGKSIPRIVRCIVKDKLLSRLCWKYLFCISAWRVHCWREGERHEINKMRLLHYQLLHYHCVVNSKVVRIVSGEINVHCVVEYSKWIK